MPTPDTAPADLDELLSRLAVEGVDLAGLAAKLAAKAHTKTVSRLADEALPLLNGGARRTYATHVRRFEHGIAAVCDQKCEPCLDPGRDFACRCDCGPCRSSRISLAPQGPLTAGPAAINTANAEVIVKAARRIAVKRGIVQNRRRAQRCLAPKHADGIGAEETAVAAMRWFYGQAPDAWGGAENPAAGIAKPHRPPGDRRALADWELLELSEITATGGDDPELDTILFDLGIETGARRQGACQLTVGQLLPQDQLIRLIDKYGRPQDAPASADLLARIARHAVARGGPQCDSASPLYRPDAHALWQANGRPLTSRRFDTLHLRWQRDLDWGGELKVSYHWLRHTLSGLLKSHFGPQYAKRYLRHADGDVTDIYGACTLEELATAMSQLLGYTHPLVTGRAHRRRQTMRRFGLDG